MKGGIDRRMSRTDCLMVCASRDAGLFCPPLLRSISYIYPKELDASGAIRGRCHWGILRRYQCFAAHVLLCLAAHCHSLTIPPRPHHDPHATHQQMPQGKRGVRRPLLSPPSSRLLLLLWWCCFASSIAPAARAAVSLRRRTSTSNHRGAFLSVAAGSITRGRTTRRMAKNGAQATPPPRMLQLEDGSICIALGRDIRPLPGKRALPRRGRRPANASFQLTPHTSIDYPVVAAVGLGTFQIKADAAYDAVAEALRVRWPLYTSLSIYD